VGYTILFSYYEIVGEEARLIDEYRLPSSQQKESLETLLIQQNYEFMSIAEIINKGNM